MFREFDFSSIYAGRIASYEAIEFAENALQIAASYMGSKRVAKVGIFFFNKKKQSSQIQTNREATLDDRRFGVFLTYSLFYLQPTDYVYQVGKLKFGIVVLFALFFPTLFWKEW